MISPAKVKYSKWSENYSYTATTVETLAMAGLKGGIRALGQKAMGVNLWNANPEVNKPITDISTKDIIRNVTTAPAKEEFIYRIVPHMIARILESTSHKKTAANVKQSADLLFSLGHSGIVVRDKRDKLKLNLNINRADHAIPVLPYIGAKNYRRLIEKRGAQHAVYSHSLNNVLSALARKAHMHLKK